MKKITYITPSGRKLESDAEGFSLPDKVKISEKEYDLIVKNQTRCSMSTKKKER